MKAKSNRHRLGTQIFNRERDAQPSFLEFESLDRAVAPEPVIGFMQIFERQ
jgi:hypothetical protein